MDFDGGGLPRSVARKANAAAKRAKAIGDTLDVLVAGYAAGKEIPMGLEQRSREFFYFATMILHLVDMPPSLAFFLQLFTASRTACRFVVWAEKPHEMSLASRGKPWDVATAM